MVSNTNTYPQYFNKMFSSVLCLNEKFKLNINELKLPNEDEQELQKLFTEIIIATPNPVGESNKIYNKPDFILSDKARNIEKILTELCAFVLSHWQVQNVLASGCKLNMDSTLVQPRCANTFFDEIKTTKGWDILLGCIGKEEFCKLLLDTIVLRKLPNGVYYQLSGPPLTESDYVYKSDGKNTMIPKSIVKPYLNTFLFDIGSYKNGLKEHLDALLYNRKRQHARKEDQIPCKKIKLSRRQKKKLEESLKTDKKIMKRKREGGLETDEKLKKRKLIEDKQQNIIEKSSLFYCGNRINKKTDELIMLLPKDHIFQKVAEFDEETRLEKCLSEIFPNEFTSTSKKKKFYKRCSTMNGMMKKILKNHKSIHFMSILDRKCPKKIPFVNIALASSAHSQVYEFIKEVLKKEKI
ncbi:MAG: hypothetical protein EXX96DRAFT_128691 [Benjaminiella poitrasii]|nr:MAG: hypothetical protein EXX96DRAFT_128691 [Benjaminiella poitrasii]